MAAPSFAFFAKEPALSELEGWAARLLALEAWNERPHFSQKRREMGHPRVYRFQELGHPPLRELWWISKSGQPEKFFVTECLRHVAFSAQLCVTFYRRNLPHLQRDYKPHFITFVTKDRRVLADWARQIVFDCCMHDHGKRYNLRVVVVMPDHVHMILTPLVDEVGRRMFPLPEIMKAIKGTSSHAINRKSGAHGIIWQEESFDHVLRSSESSDALHLTIGSLMLAMGILGIATGWGLLLRVRWAQIAAIMWAITLISPGAPLPNAGAWVGESLFIAIGIWWLRLFFPSNADEEFANSNPLSVPISHPARFQS